MIWQPKMDNIPLGVIRHELVTEPVKCIANNITRFQLGIAEPIRRCNNQVFNAKICDAKLVDMSLSQRII